MPIPKKIFFSYSNHNEDLELYDKINKHFTAYSSIGLLGIIDKKEVFRITADKAQALELIKNADVTIPLLSIDYINDEECLQQLESAATNQVKIIPVLLRDFDWQAFQKITQYKKQMLPGDLSPVENHISADNNDDTIFKEIAQSVKAMILPEISGMEFQKTPHTFYYIISSLVFVIGIIASVIVYKETNDLESAEQLLFTALCFLMFACIGLIALKNVLFPNKVRLKN
ncbi:MAG: toll/interleukin-1 receptor domain-containing protein [Chitinophagaceae bacterium]|nr:toll/interleukin-1 receptor domain-containing protein [Chitinophagaceae bacterium]